MCARRRRFKHVSTFSKTRFSAHLHHTLRELEGLRRPASCEMMIFTILADLDAGATACWCSIAAYASVGTGCVGVVAELKASGRFLVAGSTPVRAIAHESLKASAFLLSKQ